MCVMFLTDVQRAGKEYYGLLVPGKTGELLLVIGTWYISSEASF